MRVFRDLNYLPAFRRATVTIGSFDGVHAGHQKILAELAQLARSIDGESVVVTFDPHPRQIIYPQDQSLRLLTTTEEKIKLMESFGVDNLVVVPFTIEFSQLNADEYIEKFLVGKFNPRLLVIGYDHRFGLNRTGDIHYLRWHSKKYDFEVVEIEPHTVDQLTVSSTKVRQAVEKGEVDQASRLLNHYFPISGQVVKGDQIGAQIGFPTANIEIGNPLKILPPDGIYAVWAQVGNERFGGMLYIGKRPTLPHSRNRSVEVNLFDFDRNIYGTFIHLELVAFVREDRKYPDLKSMQEQLGRDQEAVQRVLSEATTGNSGPRVQVVVLNFNTRHLLESLLPSVVQAAGPSTEVVVADNGSSDGSLDAVRQLFGEKVTCLDLGRNYGFAEGYNQALSQLESDYFVLLNSDVEVSPGWLEPIIRELEADPGAAAAMPKILDYNRPSHFEYAGAAGGWMDVLGYPFCAGRIFDTVEEDTGQYDSTRKVFWASGAALVIRASLFKEIGGFDGRFFAHLEEIDLCWRLKRAGYKILAVGSSKVYHIGGGTLGYQSAKKTFLNFRNSLMTLVKNAPIAKLAWLIPLRLILDGLAGALFLYQQKPRHTWAIIRAHFSFYGQIGKTIQSRRQAARQARACQIAENMETSGIFRGSIAWQYFGKGRRATKDLI